MHGPRPHLQLPQRWQACQARAQVQRLARRAGRRHHQQRAQAGQARQRAGLQLEAGGLAGQQIQVETLQGPQAAQ